VLFAAPLPNGMHIGFIVNRPTEVALATAFPEHAPSGKVADPVYFGGPVMPDMVFAVVPTPPNDTEAILQLMPGIVLVMDGDAIDRIIETTPNDARYFAGLIVWEPGELDEEVRAGAWDVVPADASAVFSTHPETLWKTLSRGGPRLEARSGQTPTPRAGDRVHGERRDQSADVARLVTDATSGCRSDTLAQL
jgi:putative AlgH/UPF0301 family transcriptional regulator